MTITNVTVVNVTPSGFSVLWRATNSTPSIAVFSDPNGTTNLAGQVGIETFPLRTGNPDLESGYQRRVAAAALRQKTQNYGLMLVRVSHCQPDTTYYFRLTSTPNSGSPDIYPSSGPLPSVTTETENSFVANDQQLVLDVPVANAEGRIVLLSNTNAAHPLAAVIGDGVGTNQVFFNVNDLFAAASPGNFTPLDQQDFALDVLGPDGAEISNSYTLEFTADFVAAQPTVVSIQTGFLAMYVGSTIVSTGQTGGVVISGNASTNFSSVDLTLDIPSGRFTNLALQSLAPGLDPLATTITQQDSSTWLLHFQASSGQSIIGSENLARLNFTAAPNQRSAFAPLKVKNLAWTKPDSAPLGQTFAQSGRVVVIGNEPLLEAGFATNGARQLTLYGKSWMSYQIECSTNLSNPFAWKPVRHFAQTNIFTTLTGLTAPSPDTFYRAMEFKPDPPVLDALLQTNRNRVLLGYGRPGTAYSVLANTNLSDVVAWKPVANYSLTNSFHFINVPGTNSVIFYRLLKN
ncbi:MAG TPA: hypothetical protein VFM25_10105 [Verrucomicrobiae bacterium]|nr:hypothetical protein [Verrucomicrobiae bacterium]